MQQLFFIVGKMLKGIGSHHREKQYILDGMLVGQQHDNPVNTKADAAGRGHSILQRA